MQVIEERAKQASTVASARLENHKLSAAEQIKSARALQVEADRRAADAENRAAAAMRRAR